jgi:hypothetical protein
MPSIPVGQRSKYEFGTPERKSPFELCLPHYVRLADLKKAGIVKSWQQLRNMIEDVEFPPGIMLSEKRESVEFGRSTGVARDASRVQTRN